LTGSDPEDMAQIKRPIGFVDGQTTNPSLIAKNPEVMQLVDSGHRLTEPEEGAEYRKIVQAISPLVGDAGVSIEVFADLNTTAEEMLNQGRRTGWEHDPEGARCAELFNEFLERVGRRWTFFRECINVFPVSVEHNALMPALSQASRHVSTHPAKANHSKLHIYFAKVVLVEEPKN
jgi:hypothetical protein